MTDKKGRSVEIDFDRVRWSRVFLWVAVLKLLGQTMHQFVSVFVGLPVELNSIGMVLLWFVAAATARYFERTNKESAT